MGFPEETATESTEWVKVVGAQTRSRTGKLAFR